MSRDPAFGNNAFDTPKYTSETETLVNNIMFILQGKPGCYPSIPTLGMDIKSTLYMHMDDIDTNALKVELIKQCSAFMPQVDDGSFDVRFELYKNQPLLVFKVPIIIEDSSYSVNIGVTKDELSVGDTLKHAYTIIKE